MGTLRAQTEHRWNVFRSVPRSERSFEPKWTNLAAQLLKVCALSVSYGFGFCWLATITVCFEVFFVHPVHVISTKYPLFEILAYVFVHALVLFSGIIAKLLLMLMAANLQSESTFIPCVPAGSFLFVLSTVTGKRQWSGHCQKCVKLLDFACHCSCWPCFFALTSTCFDLQGSRESWSEGKREPSPRSRRPSSTGVSGRSFAFPSFCFSFAPSALSCSPSFPILPFFSFSGCDFMRH